MADKKGRKYGNVNYSREKTRLELELEKRGWSRRSAWVFVANRPDGKRFDHDEFDARMDNAYHEMGIEKLESIAIACDVSLMTVIDWIRLDVPLNKMGLRQFALMKERLKDMDNSDMVRWNLAMLVKKRFPIVQVLEAAAEGYEFPEMSDWAWNKLIKEGLIKGELRNPNPKYLKGKKDNE